MMDAAFPRHAQIHVQARLVRLAPISMLALVLAWLLWPAFAQAVQVWSEVLELSFGFLIPPVSLFVTWQRRATLARSAGKGSWAGLLVLLPALLTYLVAQRLGIHALAGLAVSPLLWGAVAFLWGWRTARVLFFPIFFLAFGLGLHRVLISAIGLPMQWVTAIGTGVVGRVLGIEFWRDGLVLQSGQWAFIVAEACSGMSSLLSLLALATWWACVTRTRPLARAAIVLAVVPVVLVANTLRVTAMLLVATWFGPATALGVFHGGSSLVAFLLALAGLFLIGRLLRCNPYELAALSS